MVKTLTEAERARIREALLDRFESLDPRTPDRQQVVRAIERFWHGGYGECAACGCDIEPRLLLMQPLADRCLRCEIPSTPGGAA